MPQKEPFILFVALLFATLTAPAVVLSLALQTTCLVGTSLANNAVVRVQPGEAQHSLTFLFPGRQYPVTGHMVESDGSEWWSLDRAEFASRSLESDPWVSADEVSPSGDCETFAASTSEEASITGTATPTAEGSIISVRATLRAQSLENLPSEIREGVWRVTVTESSLTCLGIRQNFDDDIAGDAVITRSVSPGSLPYDGNLLIREENGIYRGAIDLLLETRLVDAEISLEPTSETTMVGGLTSVADPCIIELEFELSYRSDLDD